MKTAYLSIFYFAIPSIASASSPTGCVITAPNPSPFETPKQAELAPTPTVPVLTASSSNPQISQVPDTKTGDLTFYDSGLGACGWTNDGNTEYLVALPHGLMGAQSNGNPYCGKTIQVWYMGKSVTAKVVDKCMGCENYDIDLSRKAFTNLAPEGAGRVICTWSFI